MPALITHYQFALRVLARLKQAGKPPADRDAFLLGAQGPDLFFFHRVLPWEPGKSFAREGSKMHKLSPARIFAAFRAEIDRAKEPERRLLLSYVEGFFCHYALDRTAHPFVLYWQSALRKEQPDYGVSDHTYHFRIESALDTLVLRRETGRLIRDFKLTGVLPKERAEVSAAIGRLYCPLFADWFGIETTSAHLAHAPADMRRILALMTDRRHLRQKLVIRPIEVIGRHGHFASSLLRPENAADWDYANEAHRLWENPADPGLKSRDSFYELYALAAAEAEDMILAFLEAPADRVTMEGITQDRGFASDLPGIYG